MIRRTLLDAHEAVYLADQARVTARGSRAKRAKRRSTEARRTLEQLLNNLAAIHEQGTKTPNTDWLQDTDLDKNAWRRFTSTPSGYIYLVATGAGEVPPRLKQYTKCPTCHTKAADAPVGQFCKNCMKMVACTRQGCTVVVNITNPCPHCSSEDSVSTAFVRPFGDMSDTAVLDVAPDEDGGQVTIADMSPTNLSRNVIFRSLLHAHQELNTDGATAASLADMLSLLGTFVPFLCVTTPKKIVVQILSTLAGPAAGVVEAINTFTIEGVRMLYVSRVFLALADLAGACSLETPTVALTDALVAAFNHLSTNPHGHMGSLFPDCIALIANIDTDVIPAATVNAIDAMVNMSTEDADQTDEGEFDPLGLTFVTALYDLMQSIGEVICTRGSAATAGASSSTPLAKSYS